MKTGTPPNPDQIAVKAFARGGPPVRLTTNPLAAALGCELRDFDDRSGLITLAFFPGPDFLQGNSVIQGGAVAAMLDFAMAFAVLGMVDNRRSVATISMNASFMRAAQAGEVLCRASVNRLGRKVAFASAALHTHAGAETLASATSVLSIR